MNHLIVVDMDVQFGPFAGMSLFTRRVSDTSRFDIVMILCVLLVFFQRLLPFSEGISRSERAGFEWNQVLWRYRIAANVVCPLFRLSDDLNQ